MVAVVTGAMFLLVLIRMAGLVWDREQAEVREQVLRRSAAELARGLGREDIYQATVVRARAPWSPATTQVQSGGGARLAATWWPLEDAGDPLDGACSTWRRSGSPRRAPRHG